MKNELGGKTITECVALRPKTYSYLTDDDNNAKECGLMIIKIVFLRKKS